MNSYIDLYLDNMGQYISLFNRHYISEGLSEPENSEKRFAVETIINEIRDGVRESTQQLNIADYNQMQWNQLQWDEMENGAGWLHNEIGFVFELLDYDGANLNILNTVDDYRQYLFTMSDEQLNNVLKYVLAGGTSSDELWTTVNQKRSNKMDI